MNKYACMKMPAIEIGRALANSEDDTVTLVLNKYAQEVRVLNSTSHVDAYLCSVSDGLDRRTVEVLTKLCEFAQMRLDEGVSS